MKIIGITGSIGCGKTYLANIIKSLGFFVYNPDIWTRRLYNKMDFLDIIYQKFPQVFENKVFNKRKLRNLVFSDNKQLKKLEDIIHPLLKKELKRLINKQAIKEELLFLDVALLMEMGWNKYCDYVIVAYCDKETQIQRVMQRDKVNRDDVIKIISAQTDNKVKIENADYVINTMLSEGVNRIQLINFIKEII